MLRLTREVRFALNAQPDDQLAQRPSNSYGGFPSLTGFGQYFVLRATLAGQLRTANQYLLNIRDVDEIIRRIAIPRIAAIVRQTELPQSWAQLPIVLWSDIQSAWPTVALHELNLLLTPTLSIGCKASEHPMVRLSQKFEFSASHRLHNPTLTEEQNRQTFGKCNNPLGHGHNYELQVTLIGAPGPTGVLIQVPHFERIVTETIIQPFDHKNLNAEVPQFAQTIPSVENIAMTIYQMLKPQFATAPAKLASVTVWETPKTWCEYSE